MNNQRLVTTIHIMMIYNAMWALKVSVRAISDERVRSASSCSGKSMAAKTRQGIGGWEGEQQQRTTRVKVQPCFIENGLTVGEEGVVLQHPHALLMAFLAVPHSIAEVERQT